MHSHPDAFTEIDVHQLSGITGGRSQAELKQLARRHCPQTYAQYQHRPITRPIAERCLDEAGLGMFKGQLDRYFPRR